MNLGKWTTDHTKGVILGVITPIIFIPLVVLVMSFLQSYYFEQLWDKFLLNTPFRIKIMTISIISNLAWFYFFLNRERFNVARGVIIGSLLFAPYIVYVKFF